MKKELVVTDTWNKEIYTLRFALTTVCNLDCRYCFVKKNGKVISLNQAEEILDFFLNSPGEDKLLMIYGGEPLLFFSLLKKIINFAKQAAMKNGKKLTISIGTNGTLLNKERIDFFKKENIKVSMSIDGKKEVHNKGRLSKEKTGSFARVVAKVPLLIKNIKKHNRSVLLGVLPESADELFENFLYIISLGFDSINVEPIYSPSFIWDDKQKKSFKRELQKIIGYIYENINKRNFIFLNSINRKFKQEEVDNVYDNTTRCPFYENLEIYPAGEMTFSPFLINSTKKEAYIIGSIENGIAKKYQGCKYSPAFARCKKCFSDYSHLTNTKKNIAEDVIKIRNLYSVYLVAKVVELADGNEAFADYISEAKKRIFE